MTIHLVPRLDLRQEQQQPLKTMGGNATFNQLAITNKRIRDTQTEYLVQWTKKNDIIWRREENIPTRNNYSTSSSNTAHLQSDMETEELNTPRTEQSEGGGDVTHTDEETEEDNNDTTDKSRYTYWRREVPTRKGLREERRLPARYR